MRTGHVNSSHEGDGLKARRRTQLISRSLIGDGDAIGGGVTSTTALSSEGWARTGGSRAAAA